MELLRERGPDGTTMSAVVKRSGVARATVYLRWPNRQALIAAALRRAAGHPPIDATGDLERDIRRSAEVAQQIFAEPAFRALLPAVVASVTARPANGDQLSFEALAPGHGALASEYRALAARSGLRGDIRATLVPDIVLGAMMARVLTSNELPTPADAQQLVDVILDGLRVRSTSTQG